MKTITFLRHSKSSWDYNLEDIDRPLNEVGIEKIKKLAKLSQDQFINSDIIFSSTANRAIHTCLILARHLSINYNKIILSEDLYTFNHNEVFDFIKTETGYLIIRDDCMGKFEDDNWQFSRCEPSSKDQRSRLMTTERAASTPMTDRIFGKVEGQIGFLLRIGGNRPYISKKAV
jgi:bisphosphoglycerate-dependent phosphoglycerate mutase